MPRNEPQFGEIWAFNREGARKVEGIVAKVRKESGWRHGEDNFFVTFVSSTGIRLSLTLNDFWFFKEPMPGSPGHCSCIGCDNPSFIKYERPVSQPTRQPSVEIVCPLHVPKGVQSEVVRNASLYPSGNFQAQKCRRCKEDATEVFGEIPIGLRGSMWNCQTCGQWWINGTITDLELVNKRQSISEMIMKYYILDGYMVESTDIYEDPAARSHVFDVFLKPKLDHRLKGPQHTFTIYDHLRVDVEEF